MMTFRSMAFGVLLVCMAAGATASGAPVAAEAGQDTSSAAGAWTGRISLPPGPLEIAVALAQDAATRAWTGSIDIPAQGAKGLPLGGIAIDGRAVAFDIAGIPGKPTFSGTLSGDGTSITGTFSQNGATFPFELRRGGTATVAPPPPRPQEPRPPFPYREEQVVYRNEAAAVRLAGTLTLPQGAGPFPAVLLITGSGSQDRDNTILGHKSFLLLADTLTRRGIAVLRVDDRGIGGSDRGTMEPTTADLAGDVRAGVALLDGRADIDSNHIGLIGHSEGGVIAPMVAADDPRVRFIVMLAGNGLPGEELMMLQIAAIAGTQKVPKAVIDWDLSMRRRVYDLIQSEADGEPNEAAREALIESIEPIPGVPDREVARQNVRLLLAGSSGRWFRYFLAHDPRPVLQRVTVPVLALIGSNDRQVPAAENLAAIREALEAGGNRNAVVRELPGLNHLFQTSQTGAPDEYARIEETMAPAALTLIADWVVEQTR